MRDPAKLGVPFGDAFLPMDMLPVWLCSDDDRHRQPDSPGRRDALVADAASTAIRLPCLSRTATEKPPREAGRRNVIGDHYDAALTRYRMVRQFSPSWKGTFAPQG